MPHAHRVQIPLPVINITLPLLDEEFDTGDVLCADDDFHLEHGILEEVPALEEL